jgi:hypothetical protein
MFEDHYKVKASTAMPSQIPSFNFQVCPLRLGYLFNRKGWLEKPCPSASGEGKGGGLQKVREIVRMELAPFLPQSDPDSRRTPTLPLADHQIKMSHDVGIVIGQ